MTGQQDSRSCNYGSQATHDEAGRQVPDKTCDLPKGHDEDGPIHEDYRKGFFGK